MEWLAIILSSIFTAISPAGLILDRLVENALGSQLAGVEQLAVRIDNTPSFQILEGKIDRLRIAGRGIEPLPHFSIAEIELETDPLNLDLEKLQQGGEKALNAALRQPFQGVVRLRISQSDVNQALQSPNIKAKLQELLDKLIPQREGSPTPTFEILDLRLEFLDRDRLRIQLQLQEQSEKSTETTNLTAIVLEVGFKVVAGRTLQLVEPTGSINDRRLSTKLLQGLAGGLSEQLDLRKLEAQGITSRVLQFKIAEGEIRLALFIRIEPSQSGD